ncbi:MAG: hypothetical protein JNK14_06395 [Chitinophagaceae bacterium]|nr:hypothetical protein [Chitinophagaceae bacterium]
MNGKIRHGTNPKLVCATQRALKLGKEKPRVLHPRSKFEDRSAKRLKGYWLSHAAAQSCNKYISFSTLRRGAAA